VTELEQARPCQASILWQAEHHAARRVLDQARMDYLTLAR
jgi:hypothetical protein